MESFLNLFIDYEVCFTKAGFYCDGVPCLLTEYVNYKMHGKQRWYEDGILRREDDYINDKMHGFSRAFNADGTLRREIQYVHGIRV